MLQKDLTTSWSEYMIGRVVKQCCHVLILGVMWIAKMWNEVFTTNLRYYVDWNRCERMLSWPNLRFYGEYNRWYGMLSWLRLKCYGDCKRFEMKLSRPIWDTMWNGTDIAGFGHDLIWGALWIGTDVKECGHDLIWIAILIGYYVTGSFHDQYEVLCELEQMIEDDVMT
jgi:hypothetical protein